MLVEFDGQNAVVNITSNTSTQIIGNVNLVSDPDNIYKFINAIL